MSQFGDEPGSNQLQRVGAPLGFCGFAASGAAIAFVHRTRPLPPSAEHSFVAQAEVRSRAKEWVKAIAPGCPAFTRVGR
jgi:hypothetical protein